MKHFTFKGKHYIWRPGIMATNILKGICWGAIGGVYVLAMLVAFAGGLGC